MSKTCLVGVLLLVPRLAVAIDANTLPTGGTVVAGQATIAQSGNAMTINQATDRAVINWQSFSIGQGASVLFRQPSSSSIALNRVIGQDPSQILGSLSANGQVFILNAAGVIFGRGAQVNAQGILASSRDMNVADFMAGTFRMTGSGNGTVVNEGRLQAGTGGYVVLFGAQVKNLGEISAPQGSVRLAAADRVVVTLDGGGMTGFAVERGTVDALVQNGGLIRAEGGRVWLTADAVDALAKAVVNHTGIIEAGGVEARNGSIVLLADMKVGETQVSGTLDAGKTGFVETSGHKVTIADGTVVKAANWLIDPADFTVAATGGDMSGTTLSNNLANGNVTIQSSAGGTSGSGDISINDAVSWNANLLTLTAARDVNVNAVMTVNGTSRLAINTATANGSDAGVSGGTLKMGFGPGATYTNTTGAGADWMGQINFDRSGTGILSINGHDHTVVRTLVELQAVSTASMAGYYAIGANIDASASGASNGGAGFASIGDHTTPFTGVMDGLGHTINQLTISRSSTDYVGLFGEIGSTGVLRNLGLNRSTVRGHDYVGDVAGRNDGTIARVYASNLQGAGGAGFSYRGGLVGWNTGSISQSYTTGSMASASQYNYIGGLVGYNDATGTISQTYTATYAGGLTASGGLVGYNKGSIDQSYAVNPDPAWNNNGYWAGGGSGGGLVGVNDTGGTITSSYASSKDVGSGTAGGLVGTNNGTVQDSYINSAYAYTGNASQACSAGSGTCGVTVLNDTQARSLSSFSGTGWTGQIDATGGTGKTWRIYEGYSMPLLRVFLAPLVVNGTKVYDGVAYAGGAADATYSAQSRNASVSDTTLLLGTASYGGNAISKVNAGSYGLTTTGRYSTDNRGFDVIDGGGTLSVTKRTVNLTGSRVYDGTANVGSSIFTLGNLVGGEALTLSGTGTLSDKNVANGKSVGVGSLALADGTGGLASNYTLVGGTRTANVTPRTVNLSFNKTYDGASSASVTSDDRISGDVLNFGVTASFGDKNAANGKTVTYSGLTMTGADAGNYVLALAAAGTTTANIAKRTLNLTYTGSNKSYDGTTAATVSRTDDRLVGDQLSISESAAFDNARAGNGKTINVSGITLSGADANNYQVVGSATARANVTGGTIEDIVQSQVPQAPANGYSSAMGSAGNGVGNVSSSEGSSSSTSTSATGSLLTPKADAMAAFDVNIVNAGVRLPQGVKVEE